MSSHEFPGVRQRYVLICSLALNVSCAVWMGLEKKSACVAESTTGASSLLPSVGLISATTQQQPIPAWNLQQLWQQLDLRDYGSAIVELRKINCPELVIQDIIAGALHRRYGPEIIALRRTAACFWEPVQRRRPSHATTELERESRARQLEAERNTLVRDLVGLDWPTFQSEVTGKPDPFDKLMEGFRASSKPIVRPILARYDNLERDIIRGTGGTLGNPERQELNRLYQEKINELKQWLSPLEIEEFEMRTSPTAEHLKQIGLIGFDPTEEEFRIIFKARKAFDDQQHELVMLTDASNRMPAWEGHYGMEEELRRTLGHQRYADYRRSQDYTYRGLVELTDEFDLPTSSAVQVHSLRETVLEQLRTLRQDASLAEPQRLELLRQLRAETEQAVQSTLGAAAFQRYAQLQIGGWLMELSQ